MSRKRIVVIIATRLAVSVTVIGGQPVVAGWYADPEASRSCYLCHRLLTMSV